MPTGHPTRPSEAGYPPAHADLLARRWLDGCRGELRIERIALREGSRADRELRALVIREVAGERLADDPADLAEVVDLEAARGERGRSDPQSRRHGRRPRVERHRVAVDGDA